MMKVSEHRNFATLGQLHWVIDQTPFFVLIFSFNIFLAFTATLGNTLILIALHKVLSIYPPTKFLLSCLAISDFCIAVIVHPLLAAFLMQIDWGKWYILHMTVSTLNYIFCGFSLATATAISVDRLLALLLGLRYRHTVTLRRVRCLVVCFLFANIVTGFTYSLCSQDFANSKGYVVIISSLFLSVFCHTKIFLKLRQHQAQVRHQHDCWTMADCYKAGSIFNVSALTIVYFNSTLNPILYCWKLREVREAVKTTVRKIRCFSS